MNRTQGRLVPLRSFRGNENMSFDQLLQEIVDRTKVPTLRFYGWLKPTLSLGYFQNLSRRAEHPGSAGIECVRRSTGGGALIHDSELTYSLVIPQAAGSVGPRLDLYEKTHQCMIDTLAEFGVFTDPFHSLCRKDCAERSNRFLCFQRRTREDLILHGYKIVGSAQRKSRGSLLQHGSVLLNSSDAAPDLPGANDLLSQSLTPSEIADCFADKLSKEFGLHWNEQDFCVEEVERSQAIAGQRFSSEAWLNRR